MQLPMRSPCRALTDLTIEWPGIAAAVRTDTNGLTEAMFSKTVQEP
jgi:hypothetical protein